MGGVPVAVYMYIVQQALRASIWWLHFYCSSSTATRYKQWVEILSEDSKATKALIKLVVFQDTQASVSLLAYLRGAWGVFHLTQVRGISIWLPKISSAEDEIERETFLVKSWSRWGGCVDNLGDWDQAVWCLNINILLPESLFTHFAMGYSAFPLSWPGVSREPLSLTLITNEAAIAFTIDDIHL